jgi:glycerol-3-phosphate O-acyltransferase 3/4
MWPLWILSIVIRYGLFLPLRLFVFCAASCFALSVLVPLAWVSPTGSPLIETLIHLYVKAVLLGLGLHVRYHGKKPKMAEAHIFVANHTSVTDYAVASGEGRAHAVVAQAHGGVFGLMSRQVLRPLTASLLFDRNESRDRQIVAKRMKDHVNNTKANSLLIFPEGTCVNNDYTILFHKGAFELDCVVCPIAIK